MIMPSTGITYLSIYSVNFIILIIVINVLNIIKIIALKFNKIQKKVRLKYFNIICNIIFFINIYI